MIEVLLLKYDTVSIIYIKIAIIQLCYAPKNKIRDVTHLKKKSIQIKLDCVVLQICFIGTKRTLFFNDAILSRFRGTFWSSINNMQTIIET